MTISLYALLFIVVPALALAGPPMFKDDTGTPGDGRWDVQNDPGKMFRGLHIHVFIKAVMRTLRPERHIQ
jgi:hypothetical protein